MASISFLERLSDVFMQIETSDSKRNRNDEREKIISSAHWFGFLQFSDYFGTSLMQFLDL